MKSVLLSVLMLFASYAVNAQATSTKSDEAIARKAQAKADQITKKLKLDKSKNTALYNVFKQAEERTADLTVGSSDYERLLGYIDGEKKEMLKAALSAEEYKEYEKNYSSKDKDDSKRLVEKSNTTAQKQKDQQKRDKDRSEQVMNRDKAKEEAAIKKEQDKQKKEEQKKADAEKKAAKKAKEQAKKEEEKAKQAAKKEKEQAKKEAKKK